MKYNINVVIVSTGLVILGLYYFNKQIKQNAELAKDTSKSNSVTNTQLTKTDWNKVLKKGSKGQEVGILQKALKQLTVDNDFGSATETRLKKVMKVTQTSLNQYNEFINKK